MKKSNVNLKDCEQINRQTALLNVTTGKIVAEVRDGAKTDLYEISTMEDLKEVISLEQRRLYCDKLTFYKQK